MEFLCESPCIRSGISPDVLLNEKDGGNLLLGIDEKNCIHYCSSFKFSDLLVDADIRSDPNLSTASFDITDHK